MAEAVREVQLVVVGAGPGGYAAAFLAADKGMQVVLVNSDPRPGGVCLQRGCIPSKALLHIAKLVNETAEASQWGVEFQPPKIELDKLRQWKGSVIDSLSGGIEQLSKGRKVDILRARATFADSQTLNLEWADGDGDGQPKQLKYQHCILACGSSPAMPGVFQLGDPRIMDSTGALDLTDVPKRLLVIGGGYIGLEMGTVYAALGSEVTVVEFTSGLLPGADRDLVKPLQGRLKKSFKAIHLNTKVEGLKATKDGIEASLSGEGAPKDGSGVLFDRVLVSVGRRPNSQNMGLENTKARIDEKGFVEVDRRQRTADPHILAIGDVAGEPMLAHKAAREGKVAVEALLGEPAEFDNVAIPAVVFTDPELAWCGLTEDEAKQSGREVEVARFPWAASGRALTLSRTEGLTKLIVDPKNGRVLGMGVVGVGAGELIAEGVLAVEMGVVAEDLAESIHAHPTLSETVMESSEVYLGHSTHIYRPPARK